MQEVAPLDPANGYIPEAAAGRKLNSWQDKIECRKAGKRKEKKFSESRRWRRRSILKKGRNTCGHTAAAPHLLARPLSFLFFNELCWFFRTASLQSAWNTGLSLASGSNPAKDTLSRWRSLSAASWFRHCSILLLRVSFASDRSGNRVGVMWQGTWWSLSQQLWQRRQINKPVPRNVLREAC